MEDTPALLNKALMLLCGVIPMVMIFERIPNRLEWYGDAEMCWRLEGRLNSAAIFFFPRKSPSSADISGEKGKCYIWGSDGALG